MSRRLLGPPKSNTATEVGRLAPLLSGVLKTRIGHRIVLTVAVLALLATGCTSSTAATATPAPTATPSVPALTAAVAPTLIPEPTVTPVPEATATPVPTSSPVPVVSEAPEADTADRVITVLDAGTDPQLLRLDLVVGHTVDKITATVQTSMQRVNGVVTESQTLTSIFTTVTVTGETPVGWRIEETVTGATIESNPTEVEAATRDAVEATIGTTITSVTAPDGSVAIADAGSIAGQASAGLIESAAVVFPEEPIGVGGQWQSVTTSQSLGFDFLTTTTYTVLGINNGVVDLDLRAVQDRVSDLVIPGATVESSKFESITTGTLSMNLTQPSPAVTSESAVNQTMVLTDDADELAIESETRLLTEVVFDDS